MAPPVAPPVLAILARLVEERAGLHYRDDDLPLLGERALPLALDAGFDSLLDYYYYLRYDAAGHEALDTLVEALVVGETYFFRELEPLRVLIDELLQPRLAANGRARIWSAACATGEEPLTLAMMLDERGLLDRVELVASDISERALGTAREGTYGGRSLRALPAGVAGRWMDVADGRAVVRPKVRAAVSFRKINLLDEAAVEELGKFDFVICRNVLIYFSDDTTRRVVATLGGAVAAGGALLVGISESLLRFGTALQCEEHRGSFFYMRRP